MVPEQHCTGIECLALETDEEMNAVRVGNVDPLSADSLFSRVGMTVREYATLANLVGVIGALMALFCLLALPDGWNIRVPLYLLVTVWTLLQPRVALYLLPIAIPWGSLDTVDLVGLHMNSADILVGLLAASWLMSFPIRPLIVGAGTRGGPLDHEQLNVPRYLVYAILLLLLTMFVSMVSAFNLSSSLKEMIKWLEFLALILLGAQYIRTRRQIWTIVVICCLAAISQAVYGYVQAFLNLGPQSFVRDASLRVYGTFDQPNPYAGYINMTLAVTVALTMLGRDWRTRILAGITSLLLLEAEFLSQSRGGFIAITVAILSIVLLGMPRLRVLMRVGAIGVLGVVAGYLGGLVPERFLTPVLRILGLVYISFVNPSMQDFSTAERLAHWIAGISMFADHPFTGVGIGNYSDAYPHYYITIFVNSLGQAHNYYINMAAEAGVLGLIAFLLFILALFVAGGRVYGAINKRYKALKARRAKPQAGLPEWKVRTVATRLGLLTNDRALAIGLLAALLSVCVHNMVDDLYVHSMTLLFALLLIALIRLEGVMSNVGQHGG
jgi:O-antigen ligase